MSAAAQSRDSGFATSTLLGAGTIFEGLLTFRGGARVDGELKGEIRAHGTLVVGPNARITGSVEVGELVLAGRIEGDVIAEHRVAVEPGAVLLGSVHTGRLRVDDGGLIHGPVRTGLGLGQATPAAATAKTSPVGG